MIRRLMMAVAATALFVPTQARVLFDAAVTNVAGSVLELSAGRYVLDRPLVFVHGVTLRGAANGGTVLDGAEKLANLIEIVHTGNDVFTFENLTFTRAAQRALAKGHVAYKGRGGLVVRNCRFEANGAHWDAGWSGGGRGILSRCESPDWGAWTLVTNCTFVGNAYVPAKDGRGGTGGAVQISGQVRATFVDCVFEANGISSALGEEAARYTGVMSGAALYSSQSPTEIRRCVFRDNLSVSMGEGGWMYDASAVSLGNGWKRPWPCVVEDCTFEGNRSFAPTCWSRSSPTAGALVITDSRGSNAVRVARCTFRGNRFDTEAGAAGVMVFGGKVVLAQCRFEGNETQKDALGADVKAIGRFAAVPARKTQVEVRDCVLTADANYVIAGGGADLLPYELANPSRTYCNMCGKGLRTVWPMHFGYGTLRFANCRADEAPGIEPKWVKPICVEKDRYIGWPTVCRRKNGELIAVFSGDRTAHVSNDGKVQAVRSTDGGETWSAPETWVNSPVDDRDSGLVELPNGNLALFYFSSVCYAGTGYTNDFVRRVGCDYATAKASVGAFCRISSDGGRTWGAPSRLRGIAPHGACVLSDGRLLLVSRGMRAEGNVLENDPAWAATTHRLYVECSTDGGRSWELLHAFAVPQGVDVTKIHEPHVVEAAGGALVAQFRTSLFEGVLLQSVSKDGGRSWTPLAPTKLHGHPAHLIRLADGRLMTTYGRRADHLEGGSGIYVALSSDNGATWGRELKISNNAFNVYNFGYPATADLGGGAFLSVCYQQLAPYDTPCLVAVRWNLK